MTGPLSEDSPDAADHMPYPDSMVSPWFLRNLHYHEIPGGYRTPEGEYVFDKVTACLIDHSQEQP